MLTLSNQSLLLLAVAHAVVGVGSHGTMSFRVCNTYEQNLHSDLTQTVGDRNYNDTASLAHP